MISRAEGPKNLPFFAPFLASFLKQFLASKMIENGAQNGTPKIDKIAVGGSRGCPWAPKVAKKRVPKMVPKMDPEKNDFWSKTGPTGANGGCTGGGCWGPGGPPTARAGMI